MTQTDSKLRAGIIGLGKMGLVHASTIRTHPDVEVTALCDTSKFMTQALGNFFPDVRFYGDFEKMLSSEDIDVVFVTTPTGSHAPIALECARAGKHLFVEKPLSTTLAEAEQLSREIATASVRSQVGYVCRYAPTFEKAREIIRSGALGKIQNFGSVKYSSDVTRRVEKSWRFMRKSSAGGGGVVNEFACHGIDLLIWIFGEPKGIESKLESWYSEQVEDYVHARFDYGDFSGWIDSSWSMQDYRKPYNRIDVTGENGKLFVTDSEVRWLVNESSAGHEAGWHYASVTDLYQPVRIFIGDIMFSRQADDFVASVKGGAQSRCPAEEALRTQRVLEAVRSNGVR